MVPRLVLFVSLFDGVVTAVVPPSHILSCTYPKVLFTMVYLSSLSIPIQANRDHNPVASEENHSSQA